MKISYIGIFLHDMCNNKDRLQIIRTIYLKKCNSQPEGPGIDPRSMGIFSGASGSSMCPGVDSASKNEYQDIRGGKDGRCVRMTTLPPSCAECLEILEP